uniref:Major facilitator superfamily (MFS) profile domain-containing protein n=1 Tax=Bracon brevicornis TaxID=1563983 RepID=A0A6V7J2S3_9HYME
MLYILLIFEKAGIDIDPHIATMIFASCHVIACCGTAVAVDWIGRRPLLLLSTLGMALSYFGLSVFLILSHLGFDETQFSWLPIAAMALLALSYSIGLGPLSAIMANEFFNPELASLCNCIYIMLSCVGSFLFVKLFAVFSEAVGFHYSFLGFMVACIIGFFIVLFIIPETKGRSIESIRNGLGSVQEDFSKSVELPVGYIPKLE